ncbi:uncharacterized protein BO72DRAFT_247892 [Aspergillus fijiensis CBS 313.89]|uniref:Uncharacterized protein n=1 Tax=Aspergillus fijiensis CBS 313.89 TaxID=1448319 RepID=A0A8G1RH77_9EURO|nr:uncharacterized protein BO72DRAFT_247892 [Aspergillus fijiensis CBS 313.89]RAK73280.1 hypothetical protein BO72DRAFT_247892 [Aspergillus fijiensis CBS 313.89]
MNTRTYLYDEQKAHKLYQCASPLVKTFSAIEIKFCFSIQIGKVWGCRRRFQVGVSCGTRGRAEPLPHPLVVTKPVRHPSSPRHRSMAPSRLGRLQGRPSPSLVTNSTVVYFSAMFLNLFVCLID